MERNARRRLSWLLLLPILALAAIWWKVKNDRFPYVGTWVNVHRAQDGTGTGILTFDVNGGCSWEQRWVALTDKPENAAVVRKDCSYRMEHDKAQMVLGCEMQLFGGRWSFVSLEGSRPEVPVITKLTMVTITPQQNGQVLNYKMDKGFLINQKTRQRSVQTYPLVEENFQRVK